MELADEKKPLQNDLPDEIMAKVSAFPSMPRAGIKLRALLAEEDVSVDKIEEILRHDPGLATNVLRLANSAFFGLRKKVGTLKHAVMLLGVKRFAQIAVSASMSKTMDKAVEGYDLSPGDLWIHSIAVSNIAESLARQKKCGGTNDVFTPALLHDMGKLVLNPFVKDERENIKRLTTQGIPLEIAEHMVLGTDHAEIGAMILARWSFPDDIVNAVRWHHNPERINDSTKKSDFVYLSNMLCQPHAINNLAEAQIIMPSSLVLGRLGIQLEQYDAFAKKSKFSKSSGK